jgi:peptide chain release factor subunit 1
MVLGTSAHDPRPFSDEWRPRRRDSGAMLKHEEIERLAEFDAKTSRVLSVYLDLDPSTQVRRAYRIAFEDLVKDTRLRQDDVALPQFSDEVARVQTFLETEPPRGKGLAVFTCAPQVLWRAEFLAVRAPNHLVFEPKPDVAPLLRIMDEYERYAVALVDKTRARLFSVFMGEIEESDALRDTDAIGRTDQGGWSQANYQRHHEAHVYSHLKTVAQRLADLDRRRRFERLILAGPEEAATELRRVLPRTLARRVVAVIPADIDAGVRDILDKTLSIDRLIEREDEERLLRQLVDFAGPGGRSVLGVRPTLAALWADLVQILVVAQGARGEGSECTNCERLDPGRVEKCPTCDSPMRHVHDVFHRAAQRAVERSGRAEVVFGDAERRLMQLGGGLGALLRHPSPVPHAVL